MEYELVDRPAYTTIEARLDAGESVTLESGALISHTADVEMETHTSTDGILSSLKKSMLADESVFRNTFTATTNGQVVQFAQNQPFQFSVAFSSTP